jgi:predicted RNA-binding Zn-ribbon protein involved in translation (DUF1610 family)
MLLHVGFTLRKALAVDRQTLPKCVSCSTMLHCDAEPPDFFCRECMKVRRPSFERQLDEHGHPVADSDAEAEPEADDEEEIDENDEDYWLKEDADERAYNKAVALDNTPQLGQCGVRGQPNHSCYDHEDVHVSEKVMWRW